MYVERVGIIGGGTMGADIAAVFLLSGIPVLLRDVDDARLARARQHVEMRLGERVKRGRLTEREAARRLTDLSTTVDWAPLGAVDLALEAVPEKMEIKRQVFAELDRVLPTLSLLVTNTSALSVAALAEETGRPTRVAGFHFFFPAHVMRLVEVVSGPQTSRETLASLVRVAEEIHKLPVRVRECPGFVVNRVLMRAFAEVFRFAEETGLPPAAIDRAVEESRAVPMGPYRLADALGLDVTLDVATTLQRAYGERFRPGESLVRLVSMGHLGQKTGSGFYEGAAPAVDPAAVEAARPLVRRFQLAAFAEAGRLVDEEIASVRDIDLAMRAGAGLPEGPLAWADRQGLDVVHRDLAALEQQFGERFASPESLLRRESQGRLGVATGRGYHVYQGG